MADLQDLLDILAQAISCEYPNANGVVNLNRLHELLTCLVSWKAQCVKSHSSINSPEPRQTLHAFERRNSTPSSTDPNCSPTTCADECQKIKEFQKQMLNVEVRLREIEVLDLKTTVQQLIQKEENVRKFNSTSNAELDSSETCANNLIHDETIANYGATPKHVQGTQRCSANDSIMMAKSKKSSEQSLLQEKVSVQGQSNAISRREISETSSMVTTLPVQTQTVPFMSSNELAYEEPANCVKEQYVFSRENRQHSESSTEEQYVEGKLVELDIIVAAMKKRETELSERQTKLEQMLTEYMEKLHGLLQKKDSFTGTTDNGNEVDDKPDLPECKSQQIDQQSMAEAEKLNNETFTSFATEMHLVLSELRERILSLESMVGVPHAAGGKLPLQLPHRVKCISCDGLAVMNRFAEHVPDPMLFNTNRCLKPFLKTQLNSFQKDVGHWVCTGDILRGQKLKKKSEP